MNDFMCVCTTGWGGERCHVEVDECRPQPCRNGATCTVSHLLYSCSYFVMCLNLLYTWISDHALCFCLYLLTRKIRGSDLQMIFCDAYSILPSSVAPFSRTCSMTTGAPVSQDTLEGNVRWRLMSVCPVLVRMEEHVLTLSMGTVVSVQVILRYCMYITIVQFSH